VNKEEQKPPLFGECNSCGFETELIEFEEMDFSKPSSGKREMKTFEFCNICYSSNFGNCCIYPRQHDSTESSLSRSIAYSLNMIWSDLCSKLFQMQRDYEEDQKILKELEDLRDRMLRGVDLLAILEKDNQLVERLIKRFKFVPAVDLKEELKDEEQKEKR
jgi:hypothetical protein